VTVATQVDEPRFHPLDPDIPLGDWVARGVDWATDTFSGFFSGLRSGLTTMFNSVNDLLQFPPFWVMTLLFVALALMLRRWQLAIFAAVAFYLIQAINAWSPAMYTLSMIIVAAAIAVALSIPLGVLAAKSNVVSQLLRPVLDFMQTMPPLVYLIPAVFAVGIGVQGGIVATIVFAMPPGVRFTELAIRQVDPEVVEAGQAFGSPPGRILRQIQLPLALPTIMAGINQVIMLSLSMVVLAAFIGAAGLGREVFGALSRVDVSRGVEAGIAIVILAIYLDRIIAAIADRAPVVQAQRVRD
jgi:glycine betaine/proline transport system permease protein